MPDGRPKPVGGSLNESHLSQPAPKSTVGSFFKAVFGYRKTSLTLFTVITVFLSIAIGLYEPNLELSINLPSLPAEQSLLEYSWLNLQEFAISPHPYALAENDKARNYLFREAKKLALKQPYISVNNDTNNNILYGWDPKVGDGGRTLTYYESNNILVRINGTDPSLAGFLLSAHFDSVPSADGVTDDGMGVASLMGVLKAFSTGHLKQPKRTIIFNINNDEEAGLHGAEAFIRHPWGKDVSFFLNLEGTGAGGKCILFRGTDYGVTKYFSNVRYPYASSIFQMGFNSGLIHSETDYKVYKTYGGLRGLDLAFYKPRDLYHTLGDNIKNVDQKSLWHMLSNSLDYVEGVAYAKLDLDEEFATNNDDFSTDNILNDVKVHLQTPVYASLFNQFFIVPQSAVFIINIILLVIFPLVSIPFFFAVVLRSSWNVTLINVIKFPVSIFVSYYLLQLASKVFSLWNEFLPNSHPLTLVFNFSAIFVLLNYFILNFINIVFQNKKVVNHDEKLIIILETAIFYWFLLLTCTIVGNELKSDVSGFYLITIGFATEATAGLIGLVAWYFTPIKPHYEINTIHESLPGEEEPLIGSSLGSNFGAAESENDSPHNESISSSISLSESVLNGSRTESKKSAAYGWWLQFLIIVPVASILIFTNGYLIVAGLNKTVQESLKGQQLVYEVLEQFSIYWVLPFLPFIVKLNRFAVLFVILVVLQGLYVISFSSGFDSENPLKLRFIQTINGVTSGISSTSSVSVYGRQGAGIEDILKNIGAIHDSIDTLECTNLEDGMENCILQVTKPSLQPSVIPAGKDYISIDVLRNSLNANIPYGLLTGEIQINAPANRICELKFVAPKTETDSTLSPVKSVIIFNEDKKNKTGIVDRYPDINAIPKGFSKDKLGNYIFKDLNGISGVKLNKLDWNKLYKVGFQWVPNFISSESVEDQLIDILAKHKIGIEVQCLWAGLSDNRIPLFLAFYAEAPNHVSWSNLKMGLVASSASIEV